MSLDGDGFFFFCVHLIQVLYHLRPLIITSPDPDMSSLKEDRSLNGRSNYSWLTWAVLGLGFASVILFLSKSNRLSHPTTFVKNIQLVFDTDRLSWKTRIVIASVLLWAFNSIYCDQNWYVDCCHSMVAYVSETYHCWLSSAVLVHGWSFTSNQFIVITLLWLLYNVAKLIFIISVEQYQCLWTVDAVLFNSWQGM